MQPQFIIYFSNNSILYHAEVKAFDVEENIVYDVYYSVHPEVYPVKRIQMYAGRGKGSGIYWRQRLTRIDEEQMPSEFIEAVGKGIVRANES
jgi:hypothetical protein